MARYHAAPADKDDFFISTDQELLDLEQIHHFLSEHSYWAAGVSKELVERSLRNSLCFGVYKADADTVRQLAMARVITDFATFAYLADVYVLPEHRGQGIGKWLVATVLSHPDLQLIRRWALFTRDAHDLYRRFGFEHEQNPERFMVYRPFPAQNSAEDFSEGV
jgi:GNAT superfamily N-acetyltransferase